MLIIRLVFLGSTKKKKYYRKVNPAFSLQACNKKYLGGTFVLLAEVVWVT